MGDKEVKIWAPLIASSLPPTNTWAVPHMVNQALGDPAGGGELALTESDPMFRVLALLQNMDQDLEVKAESIVREVLGCAENSLVQLFNLVARLLEQMGMGAPSIQMMGQMGSAMAEEMLGKEMAPSVLIMEVVNMETEMREMLLGSCSAA